MEALRHVILQIVPANKLLFLDGKYRENKIASNPKIMF
jgi:hypothetical protein